MAKKSFVMYESWADMITALPDAQAIMLMRAIIAYQRGDSYELKDPVLKAYFDSTIRPEMDANNKKYEAKVERANELNTKSVRSRNEVVTKSERSRNDIVREDVDVDVNEDVDVDANDDVDENEHPSGAKKRKSAQARPARHKHGEFGHVLLSDEELVRLDDKHGHDATRAAIKAVDEYCEQSGKTYKNYALVLEKWGYRSAAENARSGTTGFDANEYLLGIINGGDGG